MKPGPEPRRAHQRVTAVVALTGQHHTQVEVRDGGTPEATASLVIGRAVVYLRTQVAAAQLGALADRAARSVPRLPASLPARPHQQQPTGDAQASIITHIRGTPGGVVRLMPQTPPRTPYLHLQIGELVFHLHDRVAAHDCLTALRQVAALGGQLDVTDSRETATPRAEQPRLAGADAERARAELAPEIRRAAGPTGTQSFESPEAILARAEETLAQAQAALSSVRRAAAAFTRPATGTTAPPAAPEQRSRPSPDPPPATRADPQPNPGRNRAP